MRDARSPRLQLHPIDAAAGERIAARSPRPAERWVEDFPGQGDVAAVEAFLRATAAHGEQRPFGFYRITRLADLRVIGGIGFKGQPHGGRVEIGYGLAPSGRGQGYAADAIVALLDIATEPGASTVLANTTLDNVPSQRALARAGFMLVGTDDELRYYEARLADRRGTA